MPDFVKENSQGDAEVQSQILKEREVVASQIAEEDESERKTLYEQLQESKGMYCIFSLRYFEKYGRISSNQWYSVL